MPLQSFRSIFQVFAAFIIIMASLAPATAHQQVLGTNLNAMDGKLNSDMDAGMTSGEARNVREASVSPCPDYIAHWHPNAKPPLTKPQVEES